MYNVFFPKKNQAVDEEKVVARDASFGNDDTSGTHGHTVFERAEGKQATDI
jgi:hypothetical protein